MLLNPPLPPNFFSFFCTKLRIYIIFLCIKSISFQLQTGGPLGPIEEVLNPHPPTMGAPGGPPLVFEREEEESQLPQALTPDLAAEVKEALGIEGPPYLSCLSREQSKDSGGPQEGAPQGGGPQGGYLQGGGAQGGPYGGCMGASPSTGAHSGVGAVNAQQHFGTNSTLHSDGGPSAPSGWLPMGGSDVAGVGVAAVSLPSFCSGETEKSSNSWTSPTQILNPKP